MQNKNTTKIIVAIALLVLAMGIMGWWTLSQRREPLKVAGMPAVAVCKTCGQLQTTWDEALRHGAKDERGFFMACPKCNATARVYNPDKVPDKASGAGTQ